MEIRKATLEIQDYLENPEQGEDFFRSKLGEDAVVTFFFIGDKLACPMMESMLRQWRGEVCACTTAGEVYDGCFVDNTITAFSIVSKYYKVKNFVFDLDNLEQCKNIKNFKNELACLRNLSFADKSDINLFATLLIDGLSKKEEYFSHYIGQMLEDIPLIGGSSGDRLSFTKTLVFDGDKFRQNIAQLSIFATALPFKIFEVQSFVPTERKAVITESNPVERVVSEINGYSAAQAYADLIDIPVEHLGPDIFGKYPLMINIGGINYIRSIQRVTPEGELIFFCAIENGLVLTLGNADVYESELNILYHSVQDKKFNLVGSLFFECILRRVDILKSDEKNEYFDIYRKLKAVGFHTYGEQSGAVHINHSLTGICFGAGN